MIAKLNLNGLNPPQRAVVETTEGPVLVLAGAGTGKTRAVTVRIAYLLSKKKVSPKHILAVTFTNKAAGEMRERIQSLVGKKRAGDLTVCTFHSLCVQILRENYREAGLSRYFTIYDERDQQGLIRTAIHENHLSDRSLDPAVFLYRISDAKSNLITPKKFKDMRGDKYAEWSQLIYEAYQEMLQARSAVDFDDLIMKTILMFKAKPEVLKKYHERFRYIMVDEFQDTSTAQFTLVEQLARAHKNLCVVGDDDQSIYSWRGAQVSNILDFKKNFSKTKVVKLEQNYRSSGMILDAANAVIANNTQRHAKKLWTAAEPGVKLQLLVGHDEYSEAEFVCQHLYGIHKNFRVPHKNIAILYRSNAQSRVFEEQLRKLKVPYRIVGGQSFYDRKEVRDVVAYLRLFYNPKG